MNFIRSFVLSLFCLCLLSITSVASVAAQDLFPNAEGPFEHHKYPRYRESESHPLRILAYIVHPVGWVLRETIFRPFSAFAASTPLTRNVMGFREPFDYRESDCFRQSGVPDCWSIAPLNSIGGTGEEPEGEEATLTNSERQVFFPDVNFDFNKSTLNDLGKGRARQIAQLLSSVPDLTVVVEGHTDFKGTDNYNQALGTKRAEAVINELSSLGVDPSRMSPVSHGESRPIFTEETDWARAVNRRVQFSVGGEGVAPAAAATSENVAPAPALGNETSGSGNTAPQAVDAASAPSLDGSQNVDGSEIVEGS